MVHYNGFGGKKKVVIEILLQAYNAIVYLVYYFFLLNKESTTSIFFRIQFALRKFKFTLIIHKLARIDMQKSVCFYLSQIIDDELITRVQ